MVSTFYNLQFYWCLFVAFFYCIYNFLRFRQRYNKIFIAMNYFNGNLSQITGIANIATMVRATLDVLRDLGTKPAVVAALCKILVD